MSSHPAVSRGTSGHLRQIKQARPKHQRNKSIVTVSVESMAMSSCKMLQSHGISLSVSAELFTYSKAHWAHTGANTQATSGASQPDRGQKWSVLGARH